RNPSRCRAPARRAAGAAPWGGAGHGGRRACPRASPPRPSRPSSPSPRELPRQPEPWISASLWASSQPWRRRSCSLSPSAVDRSSTSAAAARRGFWGWEVAQPQRRRRLAPAPAISERTRWRT
ncbi:Os03g0343225, partial [Oryza sativa Japonica Group]